MPRCLVSAFFGVLSMRSPAPTAWLAAVGVWGGVLGETFISYAELAGVADDEGLPG